MIDKLPEEIWERVLSFLAQEDKTTLAYVSKTVHEKITPSLYENIYLNERYYFPSDYDNSLGTHKWSVLYITYNEAIAQDGRAIATQAKEKFQLLVRSLKESPERLCPLIKRIHCTWHLDHPTLIALFAQLNKFDHNLIHFESFIKGDINPYLWEHADTLQSLNLTPPDILPNIEAADAQYFKLTRNIVNKYNMDQIQNLTLHVNPLSFFTKGSNPLKIRSLCLNLREDTLNAEPVDEAVHYYDVFDKETLMELEMLSWYSENSADVDIYSHWKLEEFYEFKNIRDLTFLSLFANDDYIKGCIINFTKLKKLKVDFMFDTPISKATMDLMGKSPCAKTIEYLDIKIEDLDTPLLTVVNDEISNFDIGITCKCDDCKRTAEEVIFKKYFPTKESYIIKDFHDIEQRNFILQMFKLFTIIPYSSGFDEYPSIGFYSRPLKAFVKKVNSLLFSDDEKLDKKESRAHEISEDDIIALYHMFLHSMRKNFDFFLPRFQNLEFLVLNDVPTKVIQYDEFQKCNVPIFHHYNYKSNQVYELINDESLFD